MKLSLTDIKQYFHESMLLLFIKQFKNIMRYSLPLALITIFTLIGMGLGGTCPASGTASYIPNCISCLSNGNTIFCQTCLNGFYLASANSCIPCSQAIANCQFCALNLASQLQCSVCATNYGLLNNQCQNCTAISGCATCSIVTNALQCTQCQAGLVLYTVQTSCIPCQISNCDNCTIDNAGIFSCHSCLLSYYKANNTCVLCANSIQYCTSCLFDQNGKLVCSNCASSKLYLSNNECLTNCTLAGKPNCLTCQLTSLTSGVTTCSTCISGYFLNTASHNCQSCANTLAGCSVCTTNINNQTACSSCQSGYFTSGTPAICVLCSTVHTNCLNCDTTACTKCASGYYLNQTDKICYSCANSPFFPSSFPPNTCSVCSLNSSNILVCTQCANTHYNLNGICTLCSSALSNCQTCSSSTICSGCSTGYILNNNICQICSVKYPNCRYCNQNQCTDCLPGFYTLDNVNCITNCLVPNCQQCQTNNNQLCSTCLQGYNVVSGQCQISTCSPPLQFNGQACVCPIMKYPNGNVCTSCSTANCIYCPGNTCNTCFKGFYLASGTCNSCPTNCHFCIQNGLCMLCDDGYYFSGSACVLKTDKVQTLAGIFVLNNLKALCGFGCTYCTAQNICKDCITGYHLNNNKCIQCSTNCAACNLTSSQVNQTNTTVTVYTLQCLLCSSGTALFNNTCLQCTDSNCISCDFNTQFCIQCAVTLTPNSTGICVPCAKNCDFCDVGGPGTCDPSSCSIGHTRINSSACLPCMKGCTSCNNVYPFNCLGCLIGTFNNSGVCQNCPVGCHTCNSLTVCTACLDFYYLSGGSCLKFCRLPCLNCTWSNGVELCSACIRGYILSNNLCQKNISCASQTICQFCPLGSFAYKGRCHSCPSLCQSCTFSHTDPTYTITGTNYLQFTICDHCTRGYYHQPSTNSCSLCKTNCQLCANKEDCSICNDGYFIQKRHYNLGASQDTIGHCIKCDFLCLTCQISPHRCTSCPQQHILVSFKCLSLVNITFSLTLALTTTVPAQLTSIFHQVHKDIQNSLGPQYVANPQLVTYTSLQLGSLIVNGAASTSGTSNPSNTFNNFNNNVQNGNTIGGYPVSGSTVQANGFTPESQGSSSVNPIMIAVIIGAILLVIVIIVVVYCCCKRNSSKQTDSKEDTQTQSQPTTSKNMLKQPSMSSKEDQYEPPQTTKRRKRQVSHISAVDSKVPQRYHRRQKSRTPEKRVKYTQSVTYYGQDDPKSRRYRQQPSRRRSRQRERDDGDRTVNNHNKHSKTTKYIHSQYPQEYSNNNRSKRQITYDDSSSQDHERSYRKKDTRTHTSRSPHKVAGGRNQGNKKYTSKQKDKKNLSPNKNTYYI